jgi:serine/threonine-protein kinase
MDQLNAVPLDGTENALAAFFSRDGRWIGFFADGKLKKTAITGGAPTVICEAVDGYSGSWGMDDTIIFVPRWNSVLLSVPAIGGTPKIVTTLDISKGEVAHMWPQVLPGGKATLLTVVPGDITSMDDARIAVRVIGEAEPRTLVRGGTFARYVATGHLIYARKGTLLAVPFDLDRLQVSGSPATVLDGLLTYPTTGAAQFAISDTGTLAYISGGAYKPDLSLVLVDRRGVARPLLPDRAEYTEPAFSPDGRVAVSIRAAVDDIWLFDPRRPGLSRFTFGAGDNRRPVWTPDGNRIVFTWGHTGARNLFWKTADGGSEPEQLLTGEHDQIPQSVSPDGTLLAYWEANPNTLRDIWLLPLRGERKPQPFMVTSFDEWAPKFSPDGRWIAYTSNESGRAEIYVKAVQGTGGKRQISTGGGMWPVWSHNMGELFFLNGNRLMAAKIDLESGRPPSLESLFEMRLDQSRPTSSYDIALDDRTFVMVVQDEQQPARELRVFLNWFEELKRLVPTGK